MTRNLLICYVIYISCGFDLCYTCNQFGNNYCVVEQWAPWHSCNATCGGGVRMRQKYICCDKRLIDKSLKACLTSCHIPFSWWQAHAVEYNTCGKCTRGGTYDTRYNRCRCPNGYGGSCCNIRTTTTTATTTRSTTIPTTISTTISTTKSTTKSTTISTMKSTTISKRTTPTTQTSLLTSSLRIMTTKPVIITKKGFDHCVSNPCLFGRCTDMVDDFHCECVVFFKGKMCNKFTPLAIALISLTSLAVLLTCCCLCWRILGTFDKDDEKNKVKPLKRKLRPKQLGRPPRYEDW